VEIRENQGAEPVQISFAYVNTRFSSIKLDSRRKTKAAIKDGAKMLNLLYASVYKNGTRDHA
jgi:hypothetical protein